MDTLVSAVFGPVSSVSFGERWSGCRPYFENYTVDASILDNTYECCHIQLVIVAIDQFQRDPNASVLGEREIDLLLM